MTTDTATTSADTGGGAAGRTRRTGPPRHLSRPWTVLLFALFFLVDAVVLGTGVADRLGNGGTNDPASASSVAATLLEQHFPSSAPNVVLLVSPAATGATVDSPAVAEQGAELTERLAFEPGVVGVTSYWQTGAAQLRSTDHRYGLILAHLTGDQKTARTYLDHITTRYRGTPAGASALRVSLGGQVAVLADTQRDTTADLTRAEAIALPITLIVLVLVFGSVVAALLPLVVGVTAIIGTNAVLNLLTHVTDVSIFAQNLTTALGLGLAIDYALLIVRRFREELARGADPGEAVAVTLRTSGRAVLFSALTVAVSLSAMLVFPLYFLRSFAYAGISVVALAATAALVLLPALLLLLGRRIDALRLPLRARTGEPGRAWRWLAERVMRWAPLVTAAVTVLLVLLGLPFLRVQFGASDDRQLPAGTESRVVAQTLQDDFGSSATGAIEVVARHATPAHDRAALTTYAERLSALPDVATVESPVGTFQGGTAAVSAGPVDSLRSADGMSHLTITPRGGGHDISPQMQQLVRQVRQAGEADAASRALQPLAGGQAAALVDSKHAIASRLGTAAAVIALATLVLVFLLTGSLVVPLQALVLNALSLTAMFGVIVWVFQDGHLAGLLGFTPTGTIETTLPVLMFCVAFGLSMDYGVFLLARIKEEHDRGTDPRQAVAVGVQRTGGLITAAALILSVVLVAIGTSRITNTKMLGLGVALAVLVDATVVRCLLVPAVMALGSRYTWWAPAPLRRLHDRFGLREEPDPEPAEALPPNAAEVEPAS